MCARLYGNEDVTPFTKEIGKYLLLGSFMELKVYTYNR